MQSDTQQGSDTERHIGEAARHRTERLTPAGRQTHTQTNKQVAAGTQTDRQSGRHRHTQSTYRMTEKTHKETGATRKTQRDTNRHKHTYIHTDTLRETQTYIHSHRQALRETARQGLKHSDRQQPASHANKHADGNNDKISRTHIHTQTRSETDRHIERAKPSHRQHTDRHRGDTQTPTHTYNQKIHTNRQT